MNSQFLFVLSLAIFSVTVVISNIRTTPNACLKCRTSGHCVLPNCSCCGHAIPGKKSQRPQLVYFSFDDAVTIRNSPIYEQLFNENRTNPNKCPITMTLFVSHKDTDYSLVKQWYNKGMDIAVHGVNHIRPQNALQFTYEALGQRLNLANNSQIPKEEIVGFRSPYLIPFGNEQYEVLDKAGFVYDSTLTIAKRSLVEESPVPFTLDNGWPYFCSIPECPTEHIKGFWEVPIVSVIDKLGRYPCVYIDGCAFSPINEEESFNFLLENFMSYYTMNKAPFGLNMHSTWLLHEYEVNPYRMRAMKRFLDYILGLDDVYIVNMKQLIEWMKYQPKLSELSTFAPFQCPNQTRGSNESSSTETQATDDTQNQTTTSLPNESLNSVTQIKTTRNNTTGSSHQINNSQSRLTTQSNQPTSQSNDQTSRSTQPMSLSNLPSTTPYQPTTQSNKPTRILDQTESSINEPRNPTVQPSSSRTTSSSISHTRISLDGTSSTKTLRTTASRANTPQTMVTTQNTIKRNRNEPITTLQPVNNEPVSGSRLSVTSNSQVIDENSLSSANANPSTSPPVISTNQNRSKTVSLTSSIPLTESVVTERPGDRSAEPQPTTTIISHEQSPVTNDSHRQGSTNIRKTRNLPRRDGNSRRNNNRNPYQNPFRKNSGLFRLATSLIMKNDGELEKVITKDSSNHNSAVILVAKDDPIEEEEEEPQIITDMNYGEPQIITDMSYGEPQMLTGYREPVILIHNKQQRLNYENAWDESNELHIRDNLLQSEITTDTDQAKESKISSSQKIISSLRNKDIFSSKNLTTVSPDKDSGKYLKAKHINQRKSTSDFISGVNKYNKNKSSKNKRPVSIPSSYLKSAKLPNIGKSRTFSVDSLAKDLGSRNNNKNNRKNDHNNNSNNNNNNNNSNKNRSRSNSDSNASIPEFCRQGDNCIRPNCQCPHFHINTSKKIPQFVYFTYEGPINSSIATKLKDLFHDKRLNANGCRVKGTLFVTSEGSNYTAIKKLYDEGMEIALHGLKKKNLVPKLLNIEISLQKYLLKRYANISEDDIVGWRNTDLQGKGNVQFQNLKDRKMLYDSSMFVMTDLENRTGIWPSTLDFGWKNNCLLQQCPTKNFKGLWEIPAVPYVGIKKRYLCKFVDSCYNKPRTAVQTYDLLLSNFMSFYKRDRTPFGVRLRTDWFLPGNEENLKGLNAFLGLVEELTDVYIVSAKGLVDWMRDPVIPGDEKTAPSNIGC